MHVAHQMSKSKYTQPSEHITPTPKLTPSRSEVHTPTSNRRFAEEEGEFVSGCIPQNRFILEHWTEHIGM